MLRGFGDVGSTTFTAEQSFAAALGSATGNVFGGGVEVVLPIRVFVNVRASRFRETGQRVFLLEGEQFDLGIPTTITVTPVQVTGGYRFGTFDRFIPYAGAGVGWYGFTETSQFATDGENVDDRFTGFHILGGAEFGLWRWLASAASCNGRRCPTPSATIRTACLTSSTNRILAGRPSDSRSSSGCNAGPWFVAIREDTSHGFISAARAHRRPADSAGPRRHLRRHREPGRQPARLACRREHHA